MSVESLSDDVPSRQLVIVSLTRTLRRMHRWDVRTRWGASTLLLVVFFCFLGPSIYHTNQITTNIMNVNLAPGLSHILGTTPQGYDVLGRLMLGGQSALEIAIGVAILAPMIGTLVGAFAGLIGGVVDSILMRLVDTLMAIPILFIYVFIASILRPSVLVLLLLVASLAWLSPARLIRAEVLSLKEKGYMVAHRGFGGSRWDLLLRHVVKNVLPTIVVNSTFQVADAVLAVSTLAFFGFALPPPSASWGGLLSTGLNYISTGEWWLSVPVLVLLVTTIIAVNLLGEGLRTDLRKA